MRSCKDCIHSDVCYLKADFVKADACAHYKDKSLLKQVGHWIEVHKAYYSCSVCHEEAPFDWNGKYCEYCGAKMSESMVSVKTKKEAIKEGDWLLDKYTFKE